MCAKKNDEENNAFSQTILSQSGIQTLYSKAAGITDSDKQQITNLISGYNIMLNQYDKLRKDLLDIGKYIEDGSLSLNNALKAFNQSYSVNSECADNGKLNSTIKDATAVRTYLATVVIPAIDFEINDLKKRIADLEAQLL